MPNFSFFNSPFFGYNTFEKFSLDRRAECPYFVAYICFFVITLSLRKKQNQLFFSSFFLSKKILQVNRKKITKNKINYIFLLLFYSIHFLVKNGSGETYRTYSATELTSHYPRQWTLGNLKCLGPVCFVFLCCIRIQFMVKLYSHCYD